MRWCSIAGQRDSISNGGLSYLVLVCESPVAAIPSCDPPEFPARHRFRGPRKARSSHGGPTFRVTAYAMRATGLAGGLQVLDPDGGGLKVDVATGRMAKTAQTARTCTYGHLEERNASEPAVIPRVGQRCFLE